MKVIGTGLSGLVGSRIVELLGSKYNFFDFSLDSGIDISDFDKLKSAFKQHKDAKALIHLAAFTDVDKAWEQNGEKEGRCFRVNVVGTKNIAQLCAENKKYLIHISTDFVFDGKKRKPYLEEDTPCPIEWYGQTKYWAEEEVKKSGCQFTILRIAFPFKARTAAKSLEPKVKLDLVRKIIRKFEKKEILMMFFDQIITPTFIDDIIKVIDYCLINKTEGIYHCVGNTSLSPYHLASVIAEVFNFDKNLIKKITIKEVEKKNLRPRQEYLALSNGKLTREFGMKMLTIQQSLEIMKDQTEKSNDSNH